MIAMVLALTLATNIPVYANEPILKNHTEKMAKISDKTEKKLKELFSDLKSPWSDVGSYISKETRKDMNRNEVRTLLNTGLVYEADKLSKDDYVKYNQYLLDRIEVKDEEFIVDKSNKFWWNWLKNRWKDGRINERK